MFHLQSKKNELKKSAIKHYLYDPLVLLVHKQQRLPFVYVEPETIEPNDNNRQQGWRKWGARGHFFSNFG